MTVPIPLQLLQAVYVEGTHIVLKVARDRSLGYGRPHNRRCNEVRKQTLALYATQDKLFMII